MNILETMKTYNNSLKQNKYIIYSLLLLMFFLSGINKIFNFDKTVLSLLDKINPIISLDMNLYKLAIVLVIILEIVAPYIIVSNSYKKSKDKKYSLYSGYLLILFVILATLIYHPLNIKNYMKSIPFWSNVSLIGGLVLMVLDIENN